MTASTLFSIARNSPLGPQLRAALPRMEDENLREFAALDRDVTWIIVHRLRGIEPLELAARRLGLQDQRGKLPGAGVHAGREARRAPSDDDHIVDHGRRATKALPS